MSRSPSQQQTVAIVGARGYSGLELARLLLRHPTAVLSGCFATDQKFNLSAYLPESKAAKIPTWDMSEFDARSAQVGTVFLATPAEVSLELAPRALKAGAHVIDLSGAFRLKQGSSDQQRAAYQQWYGFEHRETGLLNLALDGLVPWSKWSASTAPQLVANPGCYATSILMAILPLLRMNAIEPSSIVIDAKSGTSGGGRKAAESLLFTEVDGECLPYKVARHQHWPEVVQSTASHAGVEIAPFLTTHLLNTRRGIISSIYARLTPAFMGASDAASEARVDAAFHEAYEHYPLARFGALGRPETDSLLSLKRVVGSARTHITFKAQGDKLYLFSLIDNLVKGAASQAVENLNRLHNVVPELGLVDVEGVL